MHTKNKNIFQNWIEKLKDKRQKIVAAKKEKSIRGLVTALGNEFEERFPAPKFRSIREEIEKYEYEEFINTVQAKIKNHQLSILKLEQILEMAPENKTKEFYKETYGNLE